MGNRWSIMMEEIGDINIPLPRKFRKVRSYSEFQTYECDTENGLLLNGTYVPDVVLSIMSYVPNEDTLKLALVCKNWCQIVRSNQVWKMKYEHKYRKKAKELPWFVYYCLFCKEFFNDNLLKNGNGQEGMKYWTVLQEGGDKFTIEATPQGSEPLPENAPEFNGHKSCFATSYNRCEKYQAINFDHEFFTIILDYYKPIIFATEWVCGRYDCGSKYTLQVRMQRRGPPSRYHENGGVLLYGFDRKEDIPQWSDAKWKKVCVVLADYPEGLNQIVFLHSGRDKQFWAGHYGSKFAGGVLKIFFDTIRVKSDDIYLAKERKK